MEVHKPNWAEMFMHDAIKLLASGQDYKHHYAPRGTPPRQHKPRVYGLDYNGGSDHARAGRLVRRAFR